MPDPNTFDPKRHRWFDYWFRSQLVPIDAVDDPLVERLREAAAFWRTKNTAGALLDVAADRIETLERALSRIEFKAAQLNSPWAAELAYDARVALDATEPGK